MSNKITPSLDSITIRAKYLLKNVDIEDLKAKLLQAIEPEHFWKIQSRMGEAITVIYFLEPEWGKNIMNARSGIPVFFSAVIVEHFDDSILLEAECRPAMWYKIATLHIEEFTNNQVQEAQIECRAFVKRVMSILKGKEVEPVSVYPIIARTEIKSRLLNLGLKGIVAHLVDADRHIVQDNFVESMTCSRTAFEKMVDWQMKKRGLEQTNNYKNNLERLKAKGFVDADTTQLLQSYYHCLSTLGVHEKGTPPGFYEAQMGYGITLIILDYFANKLP
ncbi:MAG: hypothetical protein ABSC91_03985 [Candidatus Bathyarchaeia archaeon]|jgi:hypothetical protein